MSTWHYSDSVRFVGPSACIEIDLDSDSECLDIPSIDVLCFLNAGSKKLRERGSKENLSRREKKALLMHLPELEEFKKAFTQRNY